MLVSHPCKLTSQIQKIMTQVAFVARNRANDEVTTDVLLSGELEVARFIGK